MKITYKEFCDVFEVVICSYRERLNDPIYYFLSGQSGTNNNDNSSLTNHTIKISFKGNKMSTTIPAHVNIEKVVYIMALMEEFGFIENGYLLKSKTQEGKFIPYVKTIYPQGIKSYEDDFQLNKKSKIWFWFFLKWNGIKIKVLNSKWFLWWLSIVVFLIGSFDNIHNFCLWVKSFF